MMKLALALVALVVVINQADASCPNINCIQDWNSANYLGKWYEYSRYSSQGEVLYSCPTYDVSKTRFTNQFVLYKKMVDEEGEDFEYEHHRAYQSSPTAGIFTVATTNAQGYSEYRIVGTDYRTFAVVWMCKNDKFDLSIWTRDQEPADSVKEAANAVIIANNLSQYEQTFIDQRIC